MTSPFAALQADVNAAVVAHLANATADFGGGVVVDGLFSNAYIDAFGMAGSRPQIDVLTSALTGIAAGAALSVGGVAYTVAEIHPDGTGMTRLLLERA